MGKEGLPGRVVVRGRVGGGEEAGRRALQGREGRQVRGEDYVLKFDKNIAIPLFLVNATLFCIH